MSVKRVHVFKTVESHPRTTYWVCLTNERGQTITPYNTGILDNALSDASEWADFLGLVAEDYVEDGVVIKPSFVLGTYREN